LQVAGVVDIFGVFVLRLFEVNSFDAKLLLVQNLSVEKKKTENVILFSF
jgi:hypothetical protein